jgi:hypothetical protein
MNYTIAAIETRYNGVNFRSRLEAKWAAMFDLLEWKWTYEPRDFDGWIPDFAIHGSRIIYVEVKPAEYFPRDVGDKMIRSGCDDRMLIVGSRVPLSGRDAITRGGHGETEYAHDELPYFGWCLHPEPAVWEPAVFGRHGMDDYIGFMGTGYFLADYTRECDAWNCTEMPPGRGVSACEIELLWREAGNRTRWNKR